MRNGIGEIFLWSQHPKLGEFKLLSSESPQKKMVKCGLNDRLINSSNLNCQLTVHHGFIIWSVDGLIGVLPNSWGPWGHFGVTVQCAHGTPVLGDEWLEWAWNFLNFISTEVFFMIDIREFPDMDVCVASWKIFVLCVLHQKTLNGFFKFLPFNFNDGLPQAIFIYAETDWYPRSEGQGQAIWCLLEVAQCRSCTHMMQPESTPLFAAWPCMALFLFERSIGACFKMSKHVYTKRNLLVPFYGRSWAAQLTWTDSDFFLPVWLFVGSCG